MTLDHAPDSRLPFEFGAVELLTERLILRLPRLSDVATIAKLANDRELAENTARVPHPYRREHAEAWVADAAISAAGATFGLYTKDDDRFVGACGLECRDRAIELGYWIGKSDRNAGLATEAARAAIDFGFTHLRREELIASARVNNPASRRVLEKCGFQWTGVALVRSKALAASVPVDRFRLDRKSWASLRAWGTVPLAACPAIQAA